MDGWYEKIDKVILKVEFMNELLLFLCAKLVFHVYKLINCIDDK